MIRRVIALIIAALTLALATTATRTAPAHAATAFATCSTGSVKVKAYSGIPVYNYYDGTKTLKGELQRNTVIICVGPVDVGSRYNGCGATNANAWLFVYWDKGNNNVLSGWTYATCLED